MLTKVFDFELTEDDMKELEALDKGESGRTFTMSAFKGYVDGIIHYDQNSSIKIKNPYKHFF